MCKYNIGDIVKDNKTDKCAEIIERFPSKVNPKKYYYFIRFINSNFGAYRSYKFLKLWKN